MLKRANKKCLCRTVQRHSIKYLLKTIKFSISQRESLVKKGG